MRLDILFGQAVVRLNPSLVPHISKNAPYVPKNCWLRASVTSPRRVFESDFNSSNVPPLRQRQTVLPRNRVRAGRSQSDAETSTLLPPRRAQFEPCRVWMAGFSLLRGDVFHYGQNQFSSEAGSVKLHGLPITIEK